MSAGSITKSVTGTLVANTVKLESVGSDPVDGVARSRVVELLLRDAVEVWFTVNGVDPTVGGADCYCALPAVGTTRVRTLVDGPVQVKMISAGTPRYQVSVGPA